MPVILALIILTKAILIWICIIFCHLFTIQEIIIRFNYKFRIRIHDLVATTFSYGSRIIKDKRSNLWFACNTQCLLPLLQREPGSRSCQHWFMSVTTIVTCQIVHVLYTFPTCSLPVDKPYSCSVLIHWFINAIRS